MQIFQSIPISRLQVMHTDVHLHCFVDETFFFTKLLSFHEEMISLQFILGNLLPRGRATNRCNKFKL